LKSLVLTVAAFSLALLSLGELRSLWFESRLARLEEITSLTKTESSLHHLGDTDLESARSIGFSFSDDGSLQAKLFSLESAIAAGAADPAIRVAHYCKALSEMGKALLREPKNPKYLLNWANVRQILGPAAVCSEEYTSGKFDAATRLALESAPNDSQVLFASAQILEWGNRRTEGRDLLKRALSVSTGLTDAQVRYIAARMQSPEDVEGIIPARFPQIVFWTSKIQSLNPELYTHSGPVLSKLQHDAIDESLTALRAGRIPAEVHQERMLSLLPLVAGPEVRRRLDVELVSNTEGLEDQELVGYLRGRQHLDEAKILPAALASDTRPAKSVLADWGTRDTVCVDDFYTTIGFFLPDGGSPRLIELHALKGDAQISESSLKVYVSEDNQVWTELQGVVKSSSILLGTGRIVAIEPHSEFYRYWKINFASAGRTRNFCNTLNRMVTVYRNASRREL
jgi:hypothetical protein